MSDNERRLQKCILIVLIGLIARLRIINCKRNRAVNERSITSPFDKRGGIETWRLTKNVSSIDEATPMASKRHESLRILYIITSLAEYNSGKRSTTAGSDRLGETLIPVMREGVLSMLDNGFMVDVFLVCHWKLQPERLSLVRQALPKEVKLDYWDDATPLGYKLEVADKHIQHVTRALARQHRFVIKDKFLDYDVFVAFEDDMLVKGELVSQNLMVSQELTRLEIAAPEFPTDHSFENASKFELNQRFYGNLTKIQLRRMMPGLIRVEVLLDEEKFPTQANTGPIPVDNLYGNSSMEVYPEYCCHIRPETVSPLMPVSPMGSKLFLWETSIEALGVRRMPENSAIDWVVLQRGPDVANVEEVIGDFWSGRNNEFGSQNRPPSELGKYLNNMGGWMASRAQIWNWHTNICPGGFLPPFDPPHFNMDGMDLRNVEYWSGGLHLFTRRNACNIQRIIPIDPEGFSKHLIYHTANNKQRQLSRHRNERFTKANVLLGQLNAIRKRAEIDRVNATQPATRKMLS